MSKFKMVLTIRKDDLMVMEESEEYSKPDGERCLICGKPMVLYRKIKYTDGSTREIVSSSTLVVPVENEETGETGVAHYYTYGGLCKSLEER